MYSIRRNKNLCSKYGIIIGADNEVAISEKLNLAIKKVSTLYEVFDFCMDVEKLGFHIGTIKDFNYIEKVFVSDDKLEGVFVNSKDSPVLLTPDTLKYYSVFKIPY